MDTTYSLKLPPKNYRRIIEELSVTIPDPVLKLKFLKQAINEYQKISSQGNLKPPIAGIAFQKKLLDNAEELWPGSIKTAKNLICNDVITAPDTKSRWVFKLRYVIGSAILMFFILGVGTAISPLVRSFNLGARISPETQQAKPPNTRIIIRKPIFYSRPSNGGPNPPSSIVKSVNSQNGPGQVLKYFQNPVLSALASQEVINSTAEHISPKPVLSSQPYRRRNHPSLAAIEPAKYQNEAEPVLKQFQNPILLALTTSQQTKNSKTDPSARKPLLSSPALKSENHSPSSIAKPEKYQNGPGWVLKYFQSPFLSALTYPQAIITISDRITQKPLGSSRPPDSESRSFSPAVISAKRRNESEPVLKHLQNPILLTLTTSQQTKNSKTDPSARKPLLSSQATKSDNHSPSSTIKPATHQNGPDLILKYSQNPLLLALTYQKAIDTKSDRITQKPLGSSQPPESENHPHSSVVKQAKFQYRPEQVPEYLQHPIWLVEKTSDREIYSNRLQIITTHTISNLPREYFRFSKNSNPLSVKGKITDKISGIVFHASESDLYPFMPEMNHSILKYSKQLIKYLLRKKSYHYFIDRFGRVYRLVREDHAAFHAGNSIWADDEEIYLNLNHAFIGICFEGKDFEEINIRKKKKGQSTNSPSTLLKPTGISSFNEAQLRSGKELTDWLRIKYNISQHNCVPHALISVNPDKMLIGFHLDLSRGFPFARFGLSDKYQQPLPSIVEFGFLYDDYFKKIFNDELWRGIRYSEEILQRQAGNSGMSFAEYRKSLQQRFSRYREWNKELLEKKDRFAENPKK
jgi:hypothetical protein